MLNTQGVLLGKKKIWLDPNIGGSGINCHHHSCLWISLYPFLWHHTWPKNFSSLWKKWHFFRVRLASSSLFITSFKSLRCCSNVGENTIQYITYSLVYNHQYRQSTSFPSVFPRLSPSVFEKKLQHFSGQTAYTWTERGPLVWWRPSWLYFPQIISIRQFPDFKSKVLKIVAPWGDSKSSWIRGIG